MRITFPSRSLFLGCTLLATLIINPSCRADEGGWIDLLRGESNSRKQVESLIAQGVRFDVCLNTVDTIERETGKRPDIIPAATPVQVGVGQILALTENGYTLVRP